MKPVPARQTPVRDPSDVLVEFRNVQKTYDGKSFAVVDLNLSVVRGEFLTLLGPSGSGKTTSLMMVAGFEQPTAGEILLDSEPISALPPHRRGIGVVFQNYALFPHMTVADNIAFPLHARGMAREDVHMKVARALDMVRLGNLAARKPGQLSGGQQQRVAVARALVFEPKLVLMDEPLGALDKQLREQLQYEIKSIHEQLGVTIIYVTHDQGEALVMSDRVAVFHNGRLAQIAPPPQLYEEPANTFVASFIGESNLIAGKVTASRDGWCEAEIAGGVTVRAHATGDFSVGETVQILVRPERIQIAEEAAEESRNQIRTTVHDVTYHGDHQRLVLELPGGGTLIARVPIQHALGQAGAGTVLWARWAADHSRALRADGPAASAAAP